MRIYDHRIVTAVWSIVGSVKEATAPQQKTPAATNGAINGNAAPAAVPDPLVPENNDKRIQDSALEETSSILEPSKKKPKTEAIG